MRVNNEFDIGDFVYLKTDVDQIKRIVSAILVKQDGLLYEVTCGQLISNHYGFEMSHQKDQAMFLGLDTPGHDS